MPEQEDKLDAGGKNFAIIASRFNDFVVEHLIKGASDALLRMGAGEDAIELYRVPGAFEIPGVACKLVDGGGFDGIICLGAVIRGATPHFDYVAGESAREIARRAALTESWYERAESCYRRSPPRAHGRTGATASSTSV